MPFLLLDPGSGMSKKSGPGSGMNNPDHISENLKIIFCVKKPKFFDADPGWKKFGSGMENLGSGILGKHPGSAILLFITSPSVCTCTNILLQVSGSGVPDSAGEVREAEPGAEPAAGRLQGRNGW